MSSFLNAYLLDIPAAYLPVQMQNRFVGHLTANGWQLLAQVDGSYSDLIPPAGESIGSGTFREVVRLHFPNNTTMTIGSYQACIANAYGQAIRLTAKTAGAVAAGVTINGVTVLGAVGSAGSSANDNLRALYYALRDSVDPVITDWTFDYNNADVLVCTRKTIAAPVACSGNANVTYADHGRPVLAGARSGRATIDATYGYSVTVDLTNGFAYYMVVFSRSIVLGTKCLSGTYGPVFASYSDHADAVAAVPAGGLCSPIELWVGKCDEASGKAYAKPTHWWAIGYAYFSKLEADATTTTIGSTADDGDAHPFTYGIAPGVPTDAWLTFDNGFGNSYPREMLFGELSNQDLGGANDFRMNGAFKVSPVRSDNASEYYNVANNFTYRFISGANLVDVYKWHGTDSNEACVYSQVYPALASYPTLAQNLDATTAYPSIALSSVAGLPGQGSLIFGGEGFDYTGLAGNSVTGVTRGANGTAQSRHFIGDTAFPVTWFLKVNNGALCCGPLKPV